MSKNACSGPARKLTLYRRLMLRPPRIVAVGIVASRSALPKLLTIIVFFLRFLSTLTPTNSPKRGKARRERAPRIPIWEASAPSVVTATQGIASAENWPPKNEIESADQNLRKSECLKRDYAPRPGRRSDLLVGLDSRVADGFCYLLLHDVPSVFPVANEPHDPAFLLQPV